MMDHLLMNTRPLINFTFKLSNSYSKFIFIMNTQEQQTHNIQSQEQKNRNPKYSKICTQILPQKSIIHSTKNYYPNTIFLIVVVLQWSQRHHHPQPKSPKQPPIKSSASLEINHLPCQPNHMGLKATA